MTRDLAQAARDYFEKALHDHYLARYRAYKRDEEYTRGFLEEHMLRWERWRENQLGLPSEVYDAHLFYIKHFTDEDIGSDRVFKVPIDDAEVFAVRTTTDGDDGYLELYDERGAWLAAARTNMEIHAWGSREWLREQAEHPGGLPPELADSHQQTLWGKELPEQESAVDKALPLVDDLPPDARELVDKVAAKIAEVDEDMRSQLARIQEKADRDKGRIQEKADREIEEISAEGRKKVEAQVKKAVTKLKALQASYAKQDQWDEAVAIHDQIKQLQASDSPAQPDPGDLTGLQTQVGKTFYFTVTGSEDGSIWGTDVYTADSTLATAAVHAGKVRPGETKVVKVKVVSPPASFRGSTRHGVDSGDFGPYPGAYQVG
jgi:hypothetical protein